MNQYKITLPLADFEDLKRAKEFWTKFEKCISKERTPTRVIIEVDKTLLKNLLRDLHGIHGQFELEIK